ncbi:MAG: thiamine phosphate synthase [Peptococcaceae bacterium]|nr:thiamine phosphate synthase [Peptococcaceae bacterium]
MKFQKEMLHLYAVTDRAWTGSRTIEEQIEQALKGGVTMVQLREKNLDGASFLQEAIRVQQLCSRYGVPLIINDNVDVALKCGADGVHVGAEDQPVEEIRKRVPADFIIGATCKTVAQAKKAEQAGADYMGVGAVFPSSTKKNAVRITKEQLCEICSSVDIPAVAIGGISRENLMQLAGTGIAGVALVSAIFAAEDIEKECIVLHESAVAMLAQN